MIIYTPIFVAFIYSHSMFIFIFVQPCCSYVHKYMADKADSDFNPHVHMVRVGTVPPMQLLYALIRLALLPNCRSFSVSAV